MMKRIFIFLFWVFCLKSYSQKTLIPENNPRDSQYIKVDKTTSTNDWGFNITIDTNVVSFVVSAMIDGKFYDYYNLGYTFSKEQIELISKVKKGSKILIEQVKVRDTEKSTKLVPGSVIIK